MRHVRLWRRRRLRGGFSGRLGLGGGLERAGGGGRLERGRLARARFRSRASYGCSRSRLRLGASQLGLSLVLSGLLSRPRSKLLLLRCLGRWRRPVCAQRGCGRLLLWCCLRARSRRWTTPSSRRPSARCRCRGCWGWDLGGCHLQRWRIGCGRRLGRFPRGGRRVHFRLGGRHLCLDLGLRGHRGGGRRHGLGFRCPWSIDGSCRVGLGRRSQLCRLLLQLQGPRLGL